MHTESQLRDALNRLASGQPALSGIEMLRLARRRRFHRRLIWGSALAAVMLGGGLVVGELTSAWRALPPTSVTTMAPSANALDIEARFALLPEVHTDSSGFKTEIVDRNLPAGEEPRPKLTLYRDPGINTLPSLPPGPLHAEQQSFPISGGEGVLTTSLKGESARADWIHRGQYFVLLAERMDLNGERLGPSDNDMIALVQLIVGEYGGR